MQSIRHGPSYGSRFGSVPCRAGYRVPGEQLCWRAHQTMRIQEVKWTHPEDCGLRIPRCGFSRWMSWTVSQFALPLSLVWLRWHWRNGVSAQPSLARYSRWYTGEWVYTYYKGQHSFHHKFTVHVDCRLHIVPSFWYNGCAVGAPAYFLCKKKHKSLFSYCK